MTSAVIATSLVLISVFVPVSFFPGTTGILYKQFALTIAFSIAISAFNALTLSPALAALVLREEKEKHGLFRWIDEGIRKVTVGYGRVTHYVLRLRFLMLVLFFAGLAATVYMYRNVPTAFLPSEDQNYLMCIVQTPQGASLTYTSDVAQKATNVILQDKDVYGTFAVMGFSLSGGASSNFGLIFVPLKSQDMRKKEGSDHTAADIQAQLAPQLFGVPGGLVVLVEPPAIQGLGAYGGFQFELQDLGRNTLGDLDRVAHEMIGAQHAVEADHQPLHELHVERSAAAGVDRSRKGEDDERIAQPDQLDTERVHGIGVRERLRLQQSLLSRLRAGGSGRPHAAE